LWLGNLKERDHLEDLSVGGKILLKFVLVNRVSTGLIWLKILLTLDSAP
jgi:hypothetical protein